MPERNQGNPGGLPGSVALGGALPEKKRPFITRVEEGGSRFSSSTKPPPTKAKKRDGEDI